MCARLQRGALLPLRFAAAKSSLRRRVCLGADGHVSRSSAHDGMCAGDAAKKARREGGTCQLTLEGQEISRSDEGFVFNE